MGCLIGLCVSQTAPAARVISTSPELTELLFQLGLGDDVVATPQFSEFPPAAKKIPELGPLFGPSIERTLRLSPDWVLIDAANRNAAYQKALEAFHQRALVLDLSRVDKVLAESERLLKTVYARPAGSVLAAHRACWDSLKAAAEGHLKGDLRPPLAISPRRFLAFAWLRPAILIGHRTFLSDLLSRATGHVASAFRGEAKGFVSGATSVNALPSSLAPPYPAVSEDWLTLQKVDTLYFLASGPDTEKLAREMFHKWWPAGHYRVVALNGDFFSRASLTPLHHLGELLGPNSPPLTKECRAIQVSR